MAINTGEAERDGEPQGKLALLDAAETLFALHGYFGTSMRDITRAADVPHGLATYHFRSKDDLFKQVVARRLPDLLDLLERGLASALDVDALGRRRVEALIDAYIGAHLDFGRRGPAETSYVRLTQQLIAVGKRRHLVAELTVRYEPVYLRYMTALSEALPDRSADFLEARFHLLRLVLAGVQVDTELPPSLSLTHMSETRATLCSFCTNGFMADDSVD
jgi:AcrR family transcriptional regulator